MKRLMVRWPAATVRIHLRWLHHQQQRWKPTARWDGDADGQHAALLQAIGEIEPSAEEQSQAWSEAFVQGDSGKRHFLQNDNTDNHATATADWDGDADGQHAALLQAIGKIEPSAEEQPQAWPEAFVQGDSGKRHFLQNDNTDNHAAASADWDGDADGQHAALLQAIGEIEPSAEEQPQAWSEAFVEVDRGKRHFLQIDNTDNHATATADWDGDADGQHAALLQAIGEIEPSAEEQPQAWSEAFVQGDSRKRHFLQIDNTDNHATAMADWDGDADGQHTALLQAIGEIEPSAEEQSQAWFEAFVQGDSRKRHFLQNDNTVNHATATADWDGDADGQHAALLQAIDEIEPSAEEQSQAWSEAFVQGDSGKRHFLQNDKTDNHAAATADWDGDADGQHAALLQAIGEIEPSAEEQSQAWSEAFVQGDSGKRHFLQNDNTDNHATATADWDGDADGQHAALLQAIGEIEPSAEEQSQAWSEAFVQGDSGKRHFLQNDKTDNHATATADWDGDADGQHAALLQAIGEIEPSAAEQSQAWSEAFVEVDSGKRHFLQNDNTDNHASATADWDGDADGQHAALLQALGEIEPSAEEQSQAWSEAFVEVDSRKRHFLQIDNTDNHATAMADWDGDADGQHAALLQAIGEIEPSAEEQWQAWSEALFAVGNAE